MHIRYNLIVFIFICCTACQFGGLMGVMGPATPSAPRCSSLNSDLLQPIAVNTRNNSKLSVQYQVSYVKQMSARKQVGSSGSIQECFLPHGIRKEVFERSLGGSLRSAGFAAFNDIDLNSSFTLDARVLEQDENFSPASKTKKVRLVVEYRLLRQNSEIAIWMKQIITEHEYEQSVTNNKAIPDTLTSAFEAAVRENLELLLMQLDSFERQEL